MAFEIISGAAADANDLVDALAANWEFDTEDTTSTNHSVTWGAVTISRDTSARLSIAKDSYTIFNPAHNESSSYTIYKASNALLMCVKYGGSVINVNSYCIVITRATSLSDETSKEKLVLITDCTRAGGLGDGEYTLGGQKIIVNGVKCLLTDGTIAGSVLRLNKGVWNIYKNTNIPLNECVNCATLNPATAIGMADRKGSLEVGKDADVVITDAEFKVLKTIIGGEIRYES